MKLDPIKAYEDDPTGAVRHPYTAFNQGYDAYTEGHDISMNPYKAGTVQQEWWRDGWLEAQDETDGDIKRVARFMLIAVYLRHIQRRRR